MNGGSDGEDSGDEDDDQGTHSVLYSQCFWYLKHLIFSGFDSSHVVVGIIVV